MDLDYIIRVLRKLAKLRRPQAKQFPNNFNLDKKELIDYTFQRCKPTPLSFADLGGVWGVDGAYTFYLIETYRVKSAAIVDFQFTDAIIDRSRSVDNLRLIPGNLGEVSVAEQVGAVDAIILFDVLLHQVKPDWNEVLEIYSQRTKYFIVCNQQWIRSEKTVRLLDLGRKEYFRNVPHGKEQLEYKKLFEKMYEIYPGTNRIWRDISSVWQWGITDYDLIQTMQKLGFKLQDYENYGRFRSLVNFENHGFVFQKLMPTEGCS